MTGPNGYAASCSATADDAGAWSCQVTLWNNSDAVGDYSYTATGETSGVSETGTFSDAQPTTVAVASPTSGTVAPGQIASYGTVSVTMGGNLTNCTVTLSDAAVGGDTGLPAGATASFTNSPITTNANYTSSLSVSTTSATAVGTYTFHVRASKGANCQGSAAPVDSTQQLTLLVKRVGTVTVASQVGTLNSGTAGSATFLVTVNKNGPMGTGTAFSASLSLTTSLPAGASASFSPSTVSLTNGMSSATSTLTITTTAATPSGTFAFTVRATNTAGSGDFSDGSGSLLIGAGCTGPTVTTNPTNQSITYGQNATFSAAASGSPSPTVQWQVNTGSGFTNIGGETNATLTLTQPAFAASGNQYRAVFTSSCGTVNTTAATLTVAKAASTTTITCPASATYTGSPLSPCTAAVTGAGGLSTTATVVYTNNTNVGTATADASYLGDANHNGSTATQKTFTIGKASSTTTVTCPAGPYTYNGSAQEPCTYTVTGAGGLNITATAVPSTGYSNNTNAGLATASYTYPDDGNHTTSNDSDTFTIGKASSTTTVTCPAGPYTYNGSAQEPCTYTVTGAGGLNITATAVPSTGYSNNTNAGLATASYTYPDDGNHTTSNDSDTFTIGKASSTTTVTCPAGPYTYNGSAQEPCTYTVTGAGGLNITATAVPSTGYSNNTNAGLATASYTYPDDGNHTTSNDSDTFTIGKASSTTTVTCPAGPYTYNGSAQEPCTYTVTGAGGLNITATAVPSTGYSNNTNAGLATASYTYPDDGNHTTSNDSDTFTIDPVHLTASVTADNKVYDGNTDATYSCSLGAGVVGTEVVTCDGAHPGVFASKNVGTRNVHVTGLALGGVDSGNYVLDNTTADDAADITPVHLTASITASNKQYDGNTNASYTCTLDAGVLGTEVVGCDGDHPGVFSSKNVGTRTATASNLVLTGADKGNYVLDTTSDTDDADITAVHLTASVTADNKVYDGNTDATYSCSLGAGVVGTEVVTCDGAHPGVFASKNVGTRNVHVTGLALGGVDSGNYVLDNTTADDAADITPVHLTASITASNKQYDGNTNASYTCTLDAGVLGTEVVGCDGDHPGVFSSKNVGTRTATASNLVLTGADKGNYVLDTTSDTDDADITAVHLTASVTADNKVYDGNTDATYSCSLGAGVVGTEVVTCDGAHPGVFASKNVGTRNVHVTGLALGGVDSGNYVLDNTTADDAADITPVHLTVSFTSQNKTWDGNNNAAVLTCSLAGVVGSEIVTCNSSAATAHFSSSAVGTWTVTATGFTLDGADKGNYLIGTVNTATYSITAWNAAGTGFYQPVGIPSSVFTAAPASAPLTIPANVLLEQRQGRLRPSR